MTKTEMCKHSNQKRTHYWAIIWPLFMIVTSPRCVMWRRDNLMITSKIAEWHFISHYHRPDLTSAKRRAHSVLNNRAVTEPESSSYLRVIFPFRAHQVWTFWSIEWNENGSFDEWTIWAFISYFQQLFFSHLQQYIRPWVTGLLSWRSQWA